MVFEAVLQLLAEFGFFRIVIPFMLIFAIVYAVILKTKVLGDDDIAKNVAAIIALATGFMVIAYTPVVDALALLIPQASFLLVTVLFMLMVLGLIFPNFGDTIGGDSKLIKFIGGIVMIIFLVIILSILGKSMPLLEPFNQLLLGNLPAFPELQAETINLLIGLLVIIGIPIVVIAVVIGAGKKD